MSGDSELLARERSWSTRAGLSGILGALLAFAGFLVLQTSLSSSTNFESLVEAHEKGSDVWAAGSLTGLGYLLLAPPLLFLFRAAQGRSERVKNQFVGLVLAGPILLGVSGLGLAGGTQQAANTYLEGTAKSTLTPKEAAKECREEAQEMGGKEFGEEFEAEGGHSSAAVCLKQKRDEDFASNAIKGSSLVKVSQFVGLAGGLALVAALLYTCLWAMRTGLLSRFWGSLGMAVGIAALIGLTPLALLWFFYLGILLVGRIPGGRPPAWAAGEAIPWPTPGEKAANALEGTEPLEGEEAQSIPEPDIPREGSAGGPDSPDPGDAERPKKRKRRDPGEPGEG
jgi:hypothetical protein